MAIRYLPDKMLARVAPKTQVKRLLTQKLTLNRAVLSTLTHSGVLSKKTLTTVALKVVKQYKARVAVEVAEGASKAKAIAGTLAGKELMVSRVQNAAVFEIGQEIKSQYEGEYYEWLPSDADEPDPIHQLNYGQVFQIGEGEQPGDRYGCRCGMNILVEETRLAL